MQYWASSQGNLLSRWLGVAWSRPLCRIIPRKKAKYNASNYHFIVKIMHHQARPPIVSKKAVRLRINTFQYYLSLRDNKSSYFSEGFSRLPMEWRGLDCSLFSTQPLMKTMLYNIFLCVCSKFNIDKTEKFKSALKLWWIDINFPAL